MPGYIIISHLCTINENHDVWFLTNGARQTEFLASLDHFLPFHPTNNPKNRNVEKKKKTPGHIILQMCTINCNHMMNDS